MAFDYSKLRGRIKEKYNTQDLFAEKLGIARTSLSLRLNGKVEFSQEEIIKSCNLLDIIPEEIPLYFFTTKV